MGILTTRPVGTEQIHTLPLVFIDIETTGHMRSEGGEICELGAVRVDANTFEPVAELDLKLQISNPNHRSESELSFNGYNGFNFADWKKAIPPADAMRQLNVFCIGSVAWGWNVSYELYWLSTYFDEYGLNWTGDYHWMDVMSVAYAQLRAEFTSGRIPKLSLSQVSAFLGLGEEPNPHRGLTGARYEHKIFKKLMAIEKA